MSRSRIGALLLALAALGCGGSSKTLRATAEKCVIVNFLETQPQVREWRIVAAEVVIVDEHEFRVKYKDGRVRVFSDLVSRGQEKKTADGILMEPAGTFNIEERPRVEGVCP